MQRYFDLIAQILAGLCLLGAIGAMLGGQYIGMAIGIGLAIFLFSYAKYLNKKEKRYVYEEDNPLSAGKERLYDEEIINRIEKAKYDPLNYKLKDIETGSMLDYKTNTWTVDQMRHIYWHDADGSTKGQLEKKIDMSHKGEELKMQVNLELPNHKVPITKAINAYAIDSNMDSYIRNGRFAPPKEITYQGEIYYRESKKSGYSIDPKDYTYVGFDGFDYYNGDKSKVVKLNFWKTQRLEAEVGEVNKEISFSNILPAPDGDDQLLISD